jgi:hypothetical protein
MAARRALLLSPALSADQILEGTVLQAFVEQAWTRRVSDGIVVAAWEKNAVALCTAGLSGRLLGPDTLGQQTTILSVASTACLAAELDASDLLVVCLNGPVPNPGFCAFATLAACANKPVVYWKDDVRKLWGVQDDPITMGLLPGASSRLMSDGPEASLTTLARLAPDGRNAFDALIKEAFAQIQGPATSLPGAYTKHLVELGKALKPDASYAELRQTVLSHVNIFSREDRKFLGLKNSTSRGS